MFLNIATDALDGAQEPEAIETTEEVKVRVVDTKQDLNKNDEPYLLLTFEAPEYPLSKNFTKYYALPFDGMDKKKLNGSSLSLRKLFKAFDVDYSGGQVDVEAMKGLEAWAILGVEDNEQYGKQNYIKKFTGAE